MFLMSGVVGFGAGALGGFELDGDVGDAKALGGDGTETVNVAADCGDGGDGLQALDYFRCTDVAGVEDEVHTAEERRDAGVQEAVGV